MFETIDTHIETHKAEYTSDTAVMESLAPLMEHGLTNLALLEYYIGEEGEIIGFQLELVAEENGQSYSRVEDFVYPENNTEWA